MKNHRNIMACIIGNILEWYEFSLFIYLSPVIAELFFPSQNKITSLLSTLFVFAAGFVIRPLGSIVLGHLGDRLGRSVTLKLTILMMSLSSVLTGLLPTYAQVGIASPMLLIVCRLLQGFCIGGEFAGSMIYLSESAQSHSRAFFSSMANNGSNFGVLIAVVGCSVASSLLSTHELSTYGWRILFISGGLLGLLGLWLRRDLAESETFVELKNSIKEKYLPLIHVVRHQRHRIVHVILLLFISACGSHILMAFISTYLNVFLHVPLDKAYHLQSLFILASLLFVPIFAYISDKIGRRPLLLFSILGYLIFALPCFWYLQFTQTWWILLPLVIFYSAEQAVTPVLMVEMFPGKGRYTGISISYNVCMALVGGFSSPIIAWAIQHFHTNMMIAYYVLFCAMVSLIIVINFLPKEFGLQSNLSTA